MFEGRTLLITGGTGTFGNAVLRCMADRGLGEIRIFSRDEKKQHDMRIEYADPRIKFYIGDVRDPDSLRDALEGVDFVFHAAALKQIPSCEFYPLQALMTNALGTENVMNAAQDAGVQRMIVLSTDKAAYPINAMGISKAMMERLAGAKSRVASSRGLTICITRYGNVMGSRGSVIPLFAEQIRSGGPLTVTDPQMTRFMMTVEDAVELVLFAFEHGSPGELFVQKAPAATIETLVAAMKRLYGGDSPVRIVGSRHGEKLYETLLTREEMLRAEDMGDYFRVVPDDRDLNYDLYFTQGVADAGRVDDYHSHNTTRLDVDGTCEILERVEGVRVDLGLPPLGAA
jgi:UDP-glucose 4-epimerase